MDQVIPAWQAHRLVASHFPPISVFEDTLDPADLEIAFKIEALTNDRLREEAGEINLVVPEDRVSGSGSRPVMAAFTHIGSPSRFTDGSYGVYYAADSLEAAIAETQFHRARFLSATNQPSLELTMRCYLSEIARPLVDIRASDPGLYNPDPQHYGPAQIFAAQLRLEGIWGLLYGCVRRSGAECVALFRSPGRREPSCPLFCAC
ncbi:RES family NAD+ phosphorylase [Azotobacter armeniacus]